MEDGSNLLASNFKNPYINKFIIYTENYND